MRKIAGKVTNIDFFSQKSTVPTCPIMDNQRLCLLDEHHMGGTRISGRDKMLTQFTDQLLCQAGGHNLSDYNTLRYSSHTDYVFTLSTL